MNGRVAKKLRKAALELSDTLPNQIYETIHSWSQMTPHKKSDDFSAEKASEKDFNVAYEMGVHDGCIEAARVIIKQFEAIAAEKAKALNDPK